MNEDLGQSISDYVSLTLEPALGWAVLAKGTDQLPSFFKLALRVVDGELFGVVPSVRDIMKSSTQPVSMVLAFLSVSADQRLQRRDYLQAVFGANPQVVTDFQFRAFRPGV